ncbi:MAG: hypothetical protein QM489_00525 [Candidatus Izemoplasma sp.]
MKDVAGIELEIGDMVAYCKVGYSRLKTGLIVSFSPKGVTIDDSSNGYRSSINRSFDQVSKIKVPNQMIGRGLRTKPEPEITGIFMQAEKMNTGRIYK